MTVVRLAFSTYEEELTLIKRAEVKALDPATQIPVASLPVKDMAVWLRENGYVWRPGSNGIWEQTGERDVLELTPAMEAA